MWITDVAEGIVPAALIGGVASMWVVNIRRTAHHELASHKEHARAERAHYAAVEAGEDDPAFAPEAIEAVVASIVALAGAIWSGAEASESSARPDSNIVRAWAGSWQSRLGRGLAADGKASVDVLNLVNRHDNDEDRVVLRVRLQITCAQPTLGQHHGHCDERWTLGRKGADWVLLSVSGDPLAGPVLSAPLVTDPSADTERLTEQSLAELSKADTTASGVAPSELVPPDEAPSLALGDLSVVDPRFDPSLLGAALAHLVESWEAAVSGSEDPLAERASQEARDALLRPGPDAQVFVRDAVLKSWEVLELHLDRKPPAVDVAVHLEVVRYLVRYETAIRAGNATDARPITLTWTLELTESTEVPWRLVSSSDASLGIEDGPLGTSGSLWSRLLYRSSVNSISHRSKRRR
jgi:hypothetical protein